MTNSESIIFNNPRNPLQELPKIGQRVRVICVKEMIFNGRGNGYIGQPPYDNDYEWLDNGKGQRSIIAWDDIEEGK